MNKKTIIWMSLLLLTAACSRENESTPRQEELRINAAVSPTRVSQQENGYVFEENDEIGIFVTPEGTAPLSGQKTYNVKNVRTASGWEPSQTMYWTSDEKGTRNDVIGYYPYAPAVTDPSAYLFTVSGNQATLKDMQRNDLLYGKTTAIKSAENTPVSLLLAHKLSRITVHVKYNSEFNGNEKISDFKIYGLSAISLDLKDGTLGGASGEPLALTPCQAAQAAAGYRYTYDAIIVPQRISSSADLFTLTIGDRALRFSTDKVFESGKHYIFNMVAGRENLSLADISIGNWTDGGSSNIVVK